MAKWDISKMTGYAVALLMAGIGISILTGLLPVQRQPAVKITFGVVFILMGLYRASLVWAKKSKDRSGGLMLVLMAAAALNGCSHKKKPPEETPERGNLQIAVSESHATLMKAEAEAFMRLYPEAHITILPMQTREAIVTLLNDSVPAAVVDRRFNAEEEKVASETKIPNDTVMIARDAMAVVVNPANDLETISMEDLSSILSGTRMVWSRFPGSGLSGPILTVLTGINSGAYELVRSDFFGLKKEFIPYVSVRTQGEVVQTVAKRLPTLGFVSLACLKDTSEFRIEKEKVRALDIMVPDSTGKPRRIKLHQANVYLGKYPLHFPVILVVRPSRSRLALGFSGFVADVAGQQIVLNRGLVPATTPIRLVQLTSGSPE
jgi:phosphate transport system substrate-binding protein